MRPAFWGPRPVMAVAAKLWPAIRSVFAEAETPNVAFSVRAFRDSLASLPRNAQAHDSWRFYTKLGALFAPGGERPTVGEGLRALRALWDEGIAYARPGDLPLAPGSLANDEWDVKARYFAAETDFPAWLLYNNLTVCDLGGGTRWFSFRGHVVGRPSAPCVVDGG